MIPETGPINSATIQTHIQGFQLAHPNIYLPIYDLLGCIKGLALWSQLSKRSFDEGPVLMVYKKPEASNQTNDSVCK